MRSEHERSLGADLGLYSITLNNDVELDHETLQCYKEFREEAERKDFRHFLEVFAPNACGHFCPERHRSVRQRQYRPHAGRRDQPRDGRCF